MTSRKTIKNAEDNLKKRINDELYEKINNHYRNNDRYNRAHIHLFKPILIINPFYILPQIKKAGEPFNPLQGKVILAPL